MRTIRRKNEQAFLAPIPRGYKVQGHEGLHWLMSRDLGRAWSKPIRLGSIRAKHADLAGSGSQLATAWTICRASTRVVVAATSDNDGATWHPPVQLSSPDAAASHPLVVWSRGRAVTSVDRETRRWTDGVARAADRDHVCCGDYRAQSMT